MGDFLDISTSLYTNSLTLFVGTGFSKYLTNNSAPSWLELLVECTRVIDKDDNLLNQLFNLDASGVVKEAVYELTICAQILEAEYKKKGQDIKAKICEIINSRINKRTIDKDKLKQLQEFFSNYPNVNIVTTNYDTLFSEHIVPLTSRVIIEGSAIPRLNSGQNIYHIHGCINKPSSIILTLNDYYDFHNSNNYFSRKFFTILQETTVTILGYSLGDFNLNTILSEVKNSKRESFRKSDIYYVTTGTVTDLIAHFYYDTYGIKVIENKTIDRFLSNVENHFDRAKELVDSVEDLKDVISGDKVYTDDFIKLRIAFSNILVQAANIGIESTDDQFLSTVIAVLQRKRDFTQESNAWEQYEHLADWLIEFASIITIKNSKIEKEYCELAKHSFRKCSKRRYKGYSWYAWREWNTRWKEMKFENQIMLQKLIEQTLWDEDLEIESIYK